MHLYVHSSNILNSQEVEATQMSINRWVNEDVAYTDTHACTHADSHTHTHTHTPIYTHTCTHTHIHTYTHVCTHTHPYTHIHTHPYTHTHIHTYTHRHMRTHTHTCMMKYYSAIKNNVIMSFTATWMGLEIIILSEVSQKEKDTYTIWYHLHVESKIWYKWTCLWDENGLI